MESFVKLLLGNFVAVIKKYFVVTGRAGRKEFWYFVLADFLIGVAFSILGLIPIIGFIVGIVSFLFWLATIIPSITLGVRRLHDTDKTGWLMLLGLIPIVGVIVLIVFWVFEGTPGENKFGAVPEENKPLNDWSDLKDLKDVFKTQNAQAPAPVSAAEETGEKKAKAAAKEEGVFCGECGAKNAKGAKFCGSCGKAL